MGDPAERLRTALDLFEAGIALYRQSLRRRYPEKSDREIDQLLNRWLSKRPGAEHGDGPPATSHE
jgi:hypothetical protein